MPLESEPQKIVAELTEEEWNIALNAIAFASGQHPSQQYRYNAHYVEKKITKQLYKNFRYFTRRGR